MLAENLHPKHILAIGGGTKNLAWMQMISNIANIQMSIPNQQIGSSYGDAFMAGVGVGLFSNLGEIRKWVYSTRQITPDPDAVAEYTPLYRIYRELYNQTQHLMRDLSALYRVLKQKGGRKDSISYQINYPSLLVKRSMLPINWFFLCILI